MPPVADNNMFDSNKIQVLIKFNTLNYTEESINTYNTGNESE